MKKFLGIVAIAAVAVATARWNFSQSQNEANFALTNIQALASGESEGNDCATHYNGPFCGSYINNSGSTINLYYP